MKLQDKETLNVADTVKDVLEGKKPVKEMDPKKHVSKKDDKFVVVNKDGDVVKSFDNEDEANKYAIDNHDDLMKEGPEEPRAKGEKEFKDKHTVKKTYGPGAVEEQVAFAFDTQKAARDFGNKVDGLPMNIVKVGSGKYYVVELRQDADKRDREKAAQVAVKIGLSESYSEHLEEVTISIDYMHKIDEKLKPGRGKETIDIDYIGDKALTKKVESKFKIKIKQTGSTTADIMGEKKNILAFMQSDAYMMDDNDIKDLFPELLEVTGQVVELPEEDKENGYVNTPIEELSDKQKEYQKVFKSAMKKFNVKSPADFKDDEKKKEFFDYIDKNYKSDNETD